ncbi:MAG: D-glycero-beta-D-manno-heptose 1,7-bisphosphate 7-phosphatase [Desulfobacterales bacterium]|jgi:D-glycero-D-manno-heptose 1,7-bisphosphate phosphatase
MGQTILNGVVFLDRDGTINHDSPDYIKNRSEFKIIPGSIEAIRRLTLSGFTSIVITNQSALARKLISPAELDHIHAIMRAAITSGGGKLTDIFFCPHLPNEGCNCRKPAPGLLLRAQLKYNIDLPTSIMVGDSAKDIECARNAGCGQAVLVKTGKDDAAEDMLKSKQIDADYTAIDLFDAANWILANSPLPH